MLKYTIKRGEGYQARWYVITIKKEDGSQFRWHVGWNGCSVTGINSELLGTAEAVDEAINAFDLVMGLNWQLPGDVTTP